MGEMRSLYKINLVSKPEGKRTLERSSIKIDVEERGNEELIWLIVRPSGGLLWTQQ
jgi:hypothetical protein